MNIAALGAISALAMLIEGSIDYFGAGIAKDYKKYVAALLGIILCIGYGADLFIMLGLVSPIPFFGSICTGVVIGRGSNFLAMFAKRIQVVPAPAQPVASALPEERI